MEYFKLFSDNYPVVIGFFYVLFKLLLKIIIHNLAETEEAIDNSLTYAWTWVDLSLLGITVSIATKLTTLLKYDYTQTVVWYLIFSTLFFFTCLMYGLFVKVKKNKKKNSFKTYITLPTLFISCIVCGGAPFIFITNKLLELWNSHLS